MGGVHVQYMFSTVDCVADAGMGIGPAGVPPHGLPGRHAVYRKHPEPTGHHCRHVPAHHTAAPVHAAPDHTAHAHYGKSGSSECC